MRSFPDVADGAEENQRKEQDSAQRALDPQPRALFIMRGTLWT
jgi:hypothetical protein